MAGRCSTSLLPKEKRDACESFWNMEVSFFSAVPAENVFMLRAVLCQTLEGIVALKQNLFIQVSI